MSSLIHIKRLKFHLVFNSQQRQWQRQRRWQQQQLKNSSCTNRWMKNRIKMPKKDVHGTSTPGSHVSCLRSISLNAVYTVHILNDWRMHVKQHIKCLLNKIDLLSFAASLFFSFFSLFFFLKTKQIYQQSNICVHALVANKHVSHLVRYTLIEVISNDRCISEICVRACAVCTFFSLFRQMFKILVQTDGEMRAEACVWASSRRKQRTEENVHNVFSIHWFYLCVCCTSLRIWYTRACFISSQHHFNMIQSGYSKFWQFGPFQYS